MSVVPLSRVGTDNPAFRLDSEFFQRANLEALARISAYPHESFGQLTQRIQHPAEVTREYADEGLDTLMAGNIRPNRTESNALPKMDPRAASAVAPNLLRRGDVLLVRTGANFGTVAPWKHDNEVFACADLLVARAPSAPAGYISSYLSCRFGKALVGRCGYGSAQPHISPLYIGLIPIPRLGKVEIAIDALIDDAVEMEREAAAELCEADATLLDALGLRGWSPPEPLTYTRPAAEVAASGRLDAEFAAPKVQALLEHLTRTGSTVGTAARARREKFRPRPPGEFQYIEIGNLDGFGRCTASTVDLAEAPSRATWHVRSGDVITSTVRPLRRLSAIVSPGQDNNVCSSGFVVLDPVQTSPELLLTFLRLPLICELMHLFATASMYPALSEADLLALPMPQVDDGAALRVQQAVQESARRLDHSERLLAAAKRAVEIAIEDSEAAALRFIAEKKEGPDAASPRR